MAETKSGEYGENQPSPIPHPAGPNSSGEPIPEPGLPDKYPSYLKPIPVNTRDIEDVMRGYINAKKPELKKILYSTWTAEREALKYQEIRNAIKSGDLPENVIDRFTRRYAEVVDQQFRPAWEDAITSGAEAMADEVEDSFGTFPAFNEQNERILDWLDRRGGELATRLTDSQHSALRASLRYYTVEDPVGPKELGRLLRSQIGLTHRQAGAVRNFRAQLIAADNDMTREQIEHQVQNYSGRLHRMRAERVARTELAWAHNRGSFEQMRQLDEGELSGRTIVKRYSTARDERTCDFCEPLDGRIVDLEDTFPGATKKIQTTYTPPVHPNCRCTIVYEVLER